MKSEQNAVAKVAHRLESRLSPRGGEELWIETGATRLGLGPARVAHWVEVDVRPVSRVAEIQSHPRSKPMFIVST